MAVDFEAETQAFHALGLELQAIAQGSAGIQPAYCDLEWSGRFTRRMGDAQVTDRTLRHGLVRLSKPLWPRAKPWKRRNTMVHEIAHVYACLEKPGEGHGAVWKRYMRLFGVPEPKRCYDASEVDRTGLRRRQKRYGFECPGCRSDIVFSQALKTRWVRNRQVRRCRRCRVSITWAFAQTAGLR